MAIRFRVRHPGGAEVLSVDDDSTVGQMQALIAKKTGISKFRLQTVQPPIRKIDLSNSDILVSEHNLRGEALNLIPVENVATTAPPESKEPKVKPKRVEVDETSVEWEEKDSYVVLRVMADDNSCLFTAFGGVFGITDPADKLRKEVAEYILEHTDKYDAVVLQKSPQAYAANIRDPQTWGGDIELGILSELYEIRISVLDVNAGRFVGDYGHDYAERCILVYSGIHYDRIVQSFSLGLPVDADVTKWPTSVEGILKKSMELGLKLKKANYYTDMHQLLVRCEVPGCEDWLGTGEVDIVKHTGQTGHTAFSEMKIT